MRAEFRQAVPQARASGRPRFRGKPEKPGLPVEQLDYFLNNPRSSVYKLSRFLQGKAADEFQRKQVAKLLERILQAGQPEEIAREIMGWLDDGPGSGFFDLLEVFCEQSADKGMDSRSLPLLKLFYRMSQTGESTTSRRMSLYYARCLLRQPNAEVLAAQMLPRFEQAMPNFDSSGVRQIFTLRQLEEEVRNGPVDRLNHRLKQLFHAKTESEEACRNDFRCLLDSRPGLPDLQVFVQDLMTLEKQEDSLSEVLVQASLKLLETIDETAMQSDGMAAFFAHKPPSKSPAEETARQKRVEKEKALLAFTALQAFRHAKLQPSDALMEGLLERIAKVNVTLRGRDVPASYSKPVFGPAWEVRYLQAVLPGNRSIPFALAVLQFYSGRNLVADKAKANLLALINEPSFAWDLKDRNTSHANIVLLAAVLKESLKKGNEAFYESLRDSILSFVGAGPAKPNGPFGLNLPNPSEALMSDSALARDMIRQFVFEVQRQNLPADLLAPLSAKSLMEPPRPPDPPRHVDLPPPKPQPPKTQEKASLPLNRSQKKKPSWWDTILDYLAWRRIKR